MRYKTRYLSTAKDDRDAIRNYLNQYSLTAATRLLEKIKAKVELAKDNPYMYIEFIHSDIRAIHLISIY